MSPIVGGAASASGGQKECVPIRWAGAGECEKPQIRRLGGTERVAVRPALVHPFARKNRRSVLNNTILSKHSN